MWEPNMFKLLCFFFLNTSLVHAYGISEINNQYDQSEDSTIEGKVFVSFVIFEDGSMYKNLGL
jgi:hypothetical protein